MYFVTNRAIHANSGSASSVFSERPNSNGPNELRVSLVEKKGKTWQAKVLDDELDKKSVEHLIRTYELNIDPNDKHYVDLQVACDITGLARSSKRNILVFIHGYNNDVVDVLERAAQLEKHYGVIVLPFSWPANGGGIKGVTDYKDDKNDAKASTVALDRFLKFISDNLSLVSSSNIEKYQKEAKQRHPDDPEKAQALYSKLIEKECPFTINIMLHSMGNYLLKQMLKSTISQGNRLIFDNIILCAADTNNLDHILWIDHIRFKRRLYITINENDAALSASRMKSGQDQLARLGHALFDLNSRKAHYVDFTNSSWIGSSHAYFEGNARTRNKIVYEFFHAAFNGKPGDEFLKYRADINCYELKR